MWINTSLDYLRHVCSDIKLRRRGNRGMLHVLGEVLQGNHAFYKVIVGDFNAKVGHSRTPEELYIGSHGLQYEQRERLSEFVMATKAVHGNSQFQKPPSLSWTWESPGGEYHNEIDHIIVNRSFCLMDVGVVPKFYTRSDHRKILLLTQERKPRSSRAKVPKPS